MIILKKWHWLIVGIILWGMLSCARYVEHRYEYLDRNEFSKMERLYLLGVDIIDNSAGEDNQVVFYSTLFVKDNFVDSFIREFNNNTEGIEVSLIEPEKIMELGYSFSSNGVVLGAYRNQPLPEVVKGRWIRGFHESLGGDGYITVEFESSVWKQNAKGFFKVYNGEGRVIWREQINDFSTYIVSDRKSPYLIKNRHMRENSVDDPYYQELEKIYRILGKTLSQEFLETVKK